MPCLPELHSAPMDPLSAMATRSKVVNPTRTRTVDVEEKLIGFGCCLDDIRSLIAIHRLSKPQSSSDQEDRMSEHHSHSSSENAAGNLMSNIMETIAENLPNQKSVRFDDGEGSIADQAKKLFGGQGQQQSSSCRAKKSIHHVLGGGKPADVLLWRNKKISTSVLGVATLVWVFIEWLDYHLLTIASFLLVLGMAVQFAWATFAAMLNGSKASSVPRVELPEELFASVGTAVGAQVNKGLCFLQDVSCGRDLKQFLMVIAAFFAAAVIGSWCNFLTVIYIGFVCAHTLPVLYERYQDQVDDFLYNMLGLLQNQYQKLDKGVLSKVPKGSSFKFRKTD
ncbi:hypothetical protein U9M48_011656 [Paspalum notatum var. saurae]|uniref:Reticulon-like protein n=1 Tax=Paspalum notatum var. saurae TaxID=547442 RepID=A0AAQ3SW98_PASNO